MGWVYVNITITSQHIPATPEESTRMSSQQSVNDSTMSDDEVRQLFASITSRMSDELSSPVKQVYVEWTYLQDVYLGTIIQHCASKDEYDKIIAKMTEYNDRLHRERSLYFPDMHLTNSDIEKYIQDKELNSLSCIYKSPFTNVFVNLTSMMEDALERNHNLRYTEHIKLIINIYPLLKTERTMAMIKFLLSDIDLREIKLGVISVPTHEVPVDYMLYADILLIDRMDLFLSVDSPYPEYFYALPKPGFMTAAIMTPKVIDNDEFLELLPTLTQKEIDRNFDLTEAICGIASVFRYLNPYIAVGKQRGDTNG